MEDQKRAISFGKLHKPNMMRIIGCSLKGFLQKKFKKQARDLSTTGKEKTPDSSFSQQCENDVIGEKRARMGF